MNFKNVFYLGVISMTLVVLSSCSKDDDPEPTLIGTWLYESFDAGKHTTTLDSTFNNAYKDDQLIFKSDGTLINTYTDGRGEKTEDRATWMLENDTLTFIWMRENDTPISTEDDYEYSVEVRELSATTLRLHDPEGWSLSSDVNSDLVYIPVTTTYKKQ